MTTATRLWAGTIVIPISDLSGRGVADVDICAAGNLLFYLNSLGCEILELGWRGSDFVYETEIVPAMAPELGGCHLRIAVGPAESDGTPAGVEVQAFMFGIDAMFSSAKTVRRLCLSAPGASYLGEAGRERLKKALGLVR